jgi:hypothetical protein
MRIWHYRKGSCQRRLRLREASASVLNPPGGIGADQGPAVQALRFPPSATARRPLPKTLLSSDVPNVHHATGAHTPDSLAVRGSAVAGGQPVPAAAGVAVRSDVACDSNADVDGRRRNREWRSGKRIPVPAISARSSSQHHTPVSQGSQAWLAYRQSNGRAPRRLVVPWRVGPRSQLGGCPSMPVSSAMSSPGLTVGRATRSRRVRGGRRDNRSVIRE